VVRVIGGDPSELEAERTARRIKDAEAPVQKRVNALEARLARVEAALAANDTSGFVTWKAVPQFLLEALAIHEEQCVQPLLDRIKKLEARPELNYCGVWATGRTYQKNSLCTRDGSLWIAKRTTAAFPGGGAEPDSWQLCVKRGADGKDAK
jgi:hypothetical protein